ncbi:hypothetical protein CW731_13720 [Polaribacter sp. ALD11]|uniref:hypothetical protein n=1 Tax=Polaribacter sp. ALD11 TaxID=2058137 RepID=UPI000C313A0E|nr:hypothetical protein [Polaribacter sp. ALD11]AUC86271.1 hypothetical protein CW731_13720 [Polaribacter sp. ALD11]
MKKLVFLFAISFFTNSLIEKSSFDEMKADDSMSKFFTVNELKELSKIVDFFEDEICFEKNKSKEVCYFDFNKKIIASALYGNKALELQIDYKLQQKLCSEIDRLFFKEIWNHNIYLREGVKYADKAYNLNQFGKYMLFLESLKEEDVLFRDFYKMFSLSNEISFGVNASAFNKLEIKEFKGIKRRLFFAIYYLTLNDKINNHTRR